MKPEALRHDPIAAYKELFVQRSDTYGRQRTRSRSYYRVNEPLSTDVLRSHLKGSTTIGLYSVDPTGKTTWSVIDSDEGVKPLQDIREELKGAGLPSYLELSRTGGHLWVFWQRPIPAPESKKILSKFRRGYELFPSGEWVDEESCGLLLRAPLGVHQASGRRYPYVDEDLQPVSRGVARGQIQWLRENVVRADPGKVAVPPEPRLPEPVVYPEVPRSPIRAYNETHNIRDVVGRLIPLSSSGTGHCPWGEQHKNNDIHRSFQVFERSGRWWCYSERVGGDLFSFLCRYHNLSPKEMLQRLED
jgi:hypothetical protein